MKKETILDAIYIICDNKLDSEKKKGSFNRYKVTIHSPTKYLARICDEFNIAMQEDNPNFYIHIDHNQALYEFRLDRYIEDKFVVTITSSNDRVHHSSGFEIDYDLIALYLERVNNNV